MGIRYLNSYIKKNTSNSLKKINLDVLNNRIITIDISIYLYRFSYDGQLMEHIYNMLSLFYYYKIFPIFIFDGKPPLEKNALIKKRNIDKNIALIKYHELEKKLLDNDFHENFDKDLLKEMSVIKKKIIKLTYNDVQKVKLLINAFGFPYIQPDCEADIICCKLVNKNIAYACMSEDMDMFLYGCKRVIRYFSLINHSAILYNLDDILKELNISFKEFKEICILSGTDYNIQDNTNLYKTLEYFKEYKKSDSNDFLLWIDKNTSYIDNIYNIYNIYNMFITNNISLNEYKKKYINFDNCIDINKIKEILKPEGFIFL